MLTHHTRALLISFAAFVLLAAIHTWPLASAPAHWARIDGDGGINTWAVNWVAHALVTDPRHVFDGNIFYPEPLTVAYSESMIIQALFAVPVVAFGGSAVLAYSVSVFAGFVLTGWAFCLLVRQWTGSWAAGSVAGSLAAFNAYSLVNFTHLQFLHAGFIAAMLFALDRLITSLRVRDAVWLAIAFALQALASIYLMVFSVFALAFALLARAGEWIRRAGPLAARLATAAIIASLILAPYLLPYWRVHESMHYARSADDAQPASWRNYVSTAARVHYEGWSKQLSGGSTTYAFPGVIALTLGGIALADARSRRDPRVRMVAVAAAGCVATSFAPLLPFYRLLHAAIPLLQMVRAVNLIAHLALLFLAVLAGFGVAVLQRWLESWKPASPGRLRAGAAVALVVLANGEALRAPIRFTRFDGIPKIYDVIAKAPAAVVIEEPFPMPQQWFLNAPSMVYSTRYWRPMLNGYSGFRPASYDKAYEAARTFPSDESLIALSALGVTHVVVHQQAMNNGQPDPRYDPYEKVASLRLLARDDDTLIYELLRR